jgi:hypothetical protein
MYRESTASDEAARGGICICNDGWVSLGVEVEDGEWEEVLYLCRRCASEATEG